MEDDDTWVSYGTPFDLTETEEGRLRALQFGKRRPVPAAFEQRVLNEKGRPLRFHGAFTGGFSAGYFNTVGSKEGFKPQSFHSSRKARKDATDEKVVQRPEDFMDDEDFGEFGIAPRRIKMSIDFDDTHVRDTIKAALGGQSVIPGSGELLKEFIVPSRGTLAERLLRRMGWRNDLMDAASSRLPEESVDDAVKAEPIAESAADHASQLSDKPLYARISFEAKTHTFGLGYSALDPGIAMGCTSQSYLRAGPDDRHPEESSAALLRRQQNLQLLTGFNPSGDRTRSGIRGQAFGVGALETDDGDIYAQDRLGDYDWEIGDRVSEDEDDEETEMDNARIGRWSSSGHHRKSSKGNSRDSGDKTVTFDGWTAPSLTKDGRPVKHASKSGMLPGFVKCSESLALRGTNLPIPSTPIPPGYVAVFHANSICDPHMKVGELSDTSGSLLRITERRNVPVRLDAISRGQILEDRSEEAQFPRLLNAGSHPLELNGSKATISSVPLSHSVLVDSVEISASGSNYDTAPNAAVNSSSLKQLPANKQSLLANLLASRFRSAGCMDLSKELSEEEAKALRAKVESLETSEPRDHAVATESYGVMTRRRLTWHPDRILCKRINVPNPYPDSTFVGCPDERRPRNPFRRGFGKRLAKDANTFSLFDILDVNRGAEGEEEADDSSEDTCSVQPLENSREPVHADGRSDHRSVACISDAVYPRGRLLFDALIEGREMQNSSENLDSNAIPTEDMLEFPPSKDAVSIKPRSSGPSRPVAAELDEERDRPSMDLFKSIFASDEELSDSESEDDSVSHIAEPAPLTGVSPAIATGQKPDHDSSLLKSVGPLFAHLFEPGGSSDDPLSTLSKVTCNVNQSRESAVKTVGEGLSHSNTDPSSFYGPELPPNFQLGVNELRHPKEALETSRSGRARNDEDQGITWLPPEALELDKSVKRVKHKRSHEKHKRHHKHKNK
ncbi:unnamed protein product [Calicophoron daubneyi]|uniref:G patch domain-containing protein n=1 Tax=Calicophoron daubneyi TaxID=300641 RepID=A0AAV2TVU7_CALDB